MAICCGSEGYVEADSSDILTLSSWEMTKTRNINAFRIRSGSGWQSTCVGTKAITGTLTGKVDCADNIQSILDTDNLVALVLYHNAGHNWSGNARISEISYTVDLDSNEPQEWTASFESDGVWTYS